MRKGKRLVWIIICILLVLSLSGCWNRRELNTFSILMGMGIDKAEEVGKIQLTAQVVKAGELKKDGGGDAEAYANIQSLGETVFDALRRFTKESNRKIYLPHSQVLIFGEDIAVEGVQKYMDFFLRDHEPRFRDNVLVAKGKAEEIFEIKSEIEKIPALGISHLVEAQGATSEATAVTLKDFACRLMSKTTTPIAPLIEISGEGEEGVLRISGMAIFKQDKWVGELEGSDARGLLWVIDKVKSGIIVVDCPKEEEEGNLSVEIIRASSKIIPEMRGDEIHITVRIKEEGHIGDQECPRELDLEDIENIEKMKAEVIRGEVLSALEKAQELNTDIFGFGEAVHRKYKKEWKEIEPRWDEIFPEIEVEIDVDAKVRRPGMLTRPASS